MKMWGLLVIGTGIVIGGAIIGIIYTYEASQMAEDHGKIDRPTDDLSRWMDERGKSKLQEDMEAEKARAKAFLLALDHYRYIIRSDASIEEATQYAKSHWNDYVNRCDEKEIAYKIKVEKDIRKKVREKK
jgi:hypothetical protein